MNQKADEAAKKEKAAEEARDASADENVLKQKEKRNTTKLMANSLKQQNCIPRKRPRRKTA